MPRATNKRLNITGPDPQLTETKAIEIATAAMLKKFPDSFEKYKPYRAKLGKSPSATVTPAI